IESHKSSAEHPIVNEFVVINIPEEDVEPKQIILNPDDQPMWESAKTEAPTLSSAIIQLDVDDNFVINKLPDMHEKYNELRKGNASKNDDTPMCECHEANYIQSEGYQNQNSQDSFSHQSLHDLNLLGDSENRLQINNDCGNDLEDSKSRIP
ncbi:hypothetical protein Tco_1007745, partial [Tanacetum coccineum]